MKKTRIVFILLSFVFLSCGKSGEDLNTSTGRLAALEKANQLLSNSQCDQAIEVLKPMYENPNWVSNDVRIAYASAYACKGGFNFYSQVNALASSSSDIFADLIKINYSASSTDGKTTAFQTAATILRNTATVSGSVSAANRKDDANLYMIFVQLNIMTTMLSNSSFGTATQSTGKKTIAVTGKGTNAEKCTFELALATISDSISYLSVSAKALTNIQSLLNTACGGTCPTNTDPSVCTATQQNEGALILIGIDSIWGF